MEEFISNLIASSSNFIGGRTLVPGPVSTPSRARGPVVLSLGGSVGTPVQQNHGTTHVTQPQILTAHNTNAMPAPSSSSILRTDMSPMIAWLTSQTCTGTGSSQESQPLSTTLDTQAHESYTSEDHRKRIPKPYIELTSRDCAAVVGQAIRSVVLHTCNDDFRQHCLSKLGASNSRDVEREIKSRLEAIITQEEQSQSDGDVENMHTEMILDQSMSTS